MAKLVYAADSKSALRHRENSKLDGILMELTDEDCVAAERAFIPTGSIRAVYIAGLISGMERAAKICEQVELDAWKSDHSQCDCGQAEAIRRAAKG